MVPRHQADAAGAEELLVDRVAWASIRLVRFVGHYCVANLRMADRSLSIGFAAFLFALLNFVEPTAANAQQSQTWCAAPNSSGSPRSGATNLDWLFEIPRYHSQIEIVYARATEAIAATDPSAGTIDVVGMDPLAVEAECSDIRTYVDSVLRPELARYPGAPDSWIKRANIKRIVLTRGLEVVVGGTASKRAAIADSNFSASTANTLFLDIYGGSKARSSTSAYKRHVFHHELFHLVDQVALGEFGRGGFFRSAAAQALDDSWKHLNPSRFGYSRASTVVESLFHPSNHDGFISGYAQYALAEDQAELFAILMVDDYKFYNVKADGTYPRLQTALKEEVSKRAGQTTSYIPLLSKIYRLSRCTLALYDEVLSTKYARVEADGLISSQTPPRFCEADLAIALVLDVSGSMQEENRLARAVAAAKANIQAMDDETMMSISAFSSSSRVVMSNTAAMNARQSAVAALNSLRPLQRTNIESGLDDGYGQLIASAAPNCAIILLTDGANNIGDPMRAVARFNSRTTGCDVSIESVGLGQDADATALKALSASTGGSYWPASSSNVAGIYQRIAAKVRNESTIVDSTEILGAGDTVELNMTIAPGTTSLGGFTSWQGSTLQATLVDPQGKELAEEEILAADGRYEISETTGLLTLPNPAPGDWKVRLHWSEPPSEPEAVSIVMTDRSPVATNFLAFEPEYKEGQVVKIRVQAAEVKNSSRIPLEDASISVEIQLPPGAGSASGSTGGGTGNPLLRTKEPGLLRGASVSKPTVIRSLDLSLEPSDPRVRSTDASFSAEFSESGYPGPYIVRATIRGKLSDGTPVEKVISSSFQVGPLANNTVRTSAMHNALLRTKRNAALQGGRSSSGGLLKASKPKNPLLR